MPEYYFDSSAIAKHYHQELGTATVDAILASPGSRHFIDRFSIVEIQSVFAKKVRMGLISPVQFQKLTRRLRADIADGMIRVKRIGETHLTLAERLLRRIAVSQNLRSLDALHLASALRMQSSGNRVHFVCSDVPLCLIAQAEGLTVINPEHP